MCGVGDTSRVDITLQGTVHYPYPGGQAGMCMASTAIDRAKEPSNLEIGLRCLLCQSWDVCRGTAS